MSSYLTALEHFNEHRNTLKMTTGFANLDSLIDSIEERRALKTYLLVLASGGMRAVEGLAIRIKDIDFSLSPTKVHIRKEYAKTRVARDVYISDEAAQYLREWIDWKHRNKQTPAKPEEELVFGVGQSTNPRELYKAIQHEFSKYLELAGFTERKDDSNRHKVTIHSLRKFVDSTITDQTGKDYAEWYLGHSRSPYYTKKEPERREIYATKFMKYLTFLDCSLLEAGRVTVLKRDYRKRPRRFKLSKSRWPRWRTRRN